MNNIAKPFWQSKTFWWNMATLGLEVVQALGQVGVIPPGTLMIVNAVGNVVLRFVTTQPVSMR